MMTSSSLKNFQLASNIDSLAKVENIIESIKDEHQIPDEIYGNILVSVSEGINNAIKHGNSLDSEKVVDFSFQITEKNYEFTISDKGPGFDFTNIPDPTHPDNLEKIDGRGVFIMKNLSDKLEFKNNGSRIILTFNKV
ncbi:MAG: serine/threonine-protein kinase RsbW [Vicingaceae bacterium]|jgi:serine/threonine-protein kinase RsbW